MRYWVYDGDYLLRKFARKEEAEHFCKGRDFTIKVQPRVKKQIDLSSLGEAPF